MSGFAWVGDDGYGRFNAHVEYAEPGPFSFMGGPEGTTVGEAVAWARRHARRVIVRIGDEHFSAGDEPAKDLPTWRPTAAHLTGSPVGEARGQSRWTAVARTGWYRPDRADVGRRLAEAVNGDSRATDAVAKLTECGFQVVFTILATSRVDANEIASLVVRAAWASLRIDATPGGDYDASSIQIR